MKSIAAPRQTDLYMSPEFIRYIADLRQLEMPTKWSEIHKLLKRDFGYVATASALKSWWAGEGRERAGVWERNPIRAKELDLINKMLARKYMGWLRLTGDFIIASDWHVPYFSAALTERLCQIAEAWKIRQLLIPGDLVSFNAYSRFDKIDRLDAVEKDKDAASALLKILFRTFDTIYWTLGNHDKRVLRMLAYGFDLADFGRILTKEAAAGQRLICSGHGYSVVNKTWRVTHPKSYSRDGGKVPAKLADKFRMSVIGAHGHHMGIQTSANKADVGIDLGGMFDPTMIDYIMQEDSTHPMWTPGFGVIRNNCYYMFTDNPRLTDWDFWLPKKGKK